MTYKLLIGQRTYSSWSLRGWLPFAVHDIPVEVEDALIYDPGFYEHIARFGGERTVPVARTPEGHVLGDSLSIGWHLAEAFPERGLLPENGADRARAMTLISEMHSGFAALRGACPMNLRTGWSGFEASEAVAADVARIDGLWSEALDRSGGPFLFGAYGLVDAFFAPVAIRIAGYGLRVSHTAQAYVTAQLTLPQILQWRAEGEARDAELTQYEMGLPRVPFPMPGVGVNHS